MDIFKTEITDKMSILRFITAGNVDDGKSTLIGRLLYETNAILDDQLEAIKRVGGKNGSGRIDLSIVTDGLKAEREQGITIDVAYKYFRTDRRKFIVADTPGHLEYTRNMITGASNTDLALILIDATKGVTEQTIRHSYLVSLLNIENILVCVNKMDAIKYDQREFEKIRQEYLKRLATILKDEVYFLPVSAFEGDNVAEESPNMPWYQGKSLLNFLETIDTKSVKQKKSRLPVQLVIKEGITKGGYRSYAGRLYGGSLSVGENVKVMPSGSSTHIKAISIGKRSVNMATNGQSIVFETTEDVDISRGSLLIPAEDNVKSQKEILVNICWMDSEPLSLQKVYLLQMHSQRLHVRTKEIINVIDLSTLKELKVQTLYKNDIGKVRLHASAPIQYDSFDESRVTGSGILIDPQTNNTAAVMLFD